MDLKGRDFLTLKGFHPGRDCLSAGSVRRAEGEEKERHSGGYPAR